MTLKNSKLLALLFFNLIFISSAFSQQQKKSLSLEEIWNSPTFINKQIYGINSMLDGEHYTSLDQTQTGSEINQYSYKTGKLVKNIVKSIDLIPPGQSKCIIIENYQFNMDETQLLISSETENIYRHSTKSNYYLYNLKTKALTPLSNNGKQRLATFNPKLNMIAFVRDNNLFIKNIDLDTEIKITGDGFINEIINGATDWVYEEEFSISQAYFWSSDGLKLAYYKFDEKQVKEFSMTMYGSLYPSETKYKYPKAGEKNSEVSIHIYNVLSQTTKPVFIGINPDQYIPRIKWTCNPDILALERLNRNQNKMEILLCNNNVKPLSGLDTKVIYTEESSTYIDGSDEKITFLNDNKHFIWLSDKDGFNHLYLFDLEGKEIKQLTKGNWDVIDFLGVNEINQTLYYVSSESSAMDRELFSIKMDGSNKTKLSEKKGHNIPNFSNGFKYYINTHSDANTPSYITLNKSDGKVIREIEKNEDLTKTLEKYALSKKEFFQFKTSENVLLNGWMIKPSNFKPDNTYPVFMTVYGGPGAQTVNNKWEGANYLWHQHLTELGYIVVSVDNRGTGARGREFKNSTYLQLGKIETQDQIETAKYLGNLSFVDKKRIGIQGWSYGGYMSSLCITKGADFFKMAIAVAPVTNWKFYDSIYTERYMRSPKDNAKGYEENSPINFVDKLKGKYLLIHGTADDNVHFQNAVEMTDALINANKQFDNAYYPNKNHGIYGGIIRLNLYTKMTEFIKENL